MVTTNIPINRFNSIASEIICQAKQKQNIRKSFVVHTLPSPHLKLYDCNVHLRINFLTNSIFTDKPQLEENDVTVVNENERVVVTRRISSNPLSNISWYDGSVLLKSEMAVNSTTFIIEKARCTDTKNFTLIVSNSLQSNVTSLVELIVNCKYDYMLLFKNRGANLRTFTFRRKMQVLIVL